MNQVNPVKQLNQVKPANQVKQVNKVNQVNQVKQVKRKKKEKKEREFLAGGRRDQSMVVQDVLADLKMESWCTWNNISLSDKDCPSHLIP